MKIKETIHTSISEYNELLDGTVLIVWSVEVNGELLDELGFNESMEKFVSGGDADFCVSVICGRFNRGFGGGGTNIRWSFFARTVFSNILLNKNKI